MTVTIELSPETRRRLEAEAIRRGISLDELVAEFAETLPTENGKSNTSVLEDFLGSGDSGDPGWATRDTRELRREAAGRSLDGS